MEIDNAQDNIHNVAANIYNLFRSHGYGDDRIFYMATDPELEGWDAMPTWENLRGAITQWAATQVGPDRALTVYLVDHGDANKLYLDKVSGQWVTPDDLDQWLEELEASQPGVRVNVVVEACSAGSFIKAEEISGQIVGTVSSPGRVVITSTDAWNDAWTAGDGILFSDHFLMALGQEANLYHSFETARWAVQASNSFQTPWLDDNGNAVANEESDGQEAAQRGFAFAGTLPADVWPPYIIDATGPTQVVQGQGTIGAEVLDDEAVAFVWAVIYPPSYQPPPPGEELISEALPTIVLSAQGNDVYSALYTGFHEVGLYRVVVHAMDNDLREARPVTLEVRTGWNAYLPLILR
jgi:hypothetical protein